MTNHWIDLKNSDVILIMGSNAAENHPISFKYVTEAQKHGGKLINVDPRFTRTSAKADIYAPLRSGTDIAFLGGMIKYIIDNKLYDEEYVVGYTDASMLVGEGFDFKDGLFSGYDSQKRSYDKSKWALQMDANGVPKRDLTLQDKRCVFQLLKAHYDRYNLKLVAQITGTPEKDLLEVYKVYAATGAKGKAGTIMYAMGWTQHTVGVQNIRTMSIIQTLLGNMGVAGGGVNALRGESNVQGSTDAALLFHIIPGYLATPATNWPKLEDYLKRRPKSADPLSANWWQNEPKYMVSLLKAFFGEAATKDNEFGYQWLPKLDAGKAYSWLDLFDAMYQGSIKGFFAWGMNPACSGSNAGKNREAMAKLDWMVNVNLFDNETGSFWRGPGMNPASIKTEVFMLPACVSVEKEGSVTNSGRWMQWRYAGPKPMGQSRPDGDIILALGNKIRELYKKEGGAFPEPVLNLKWDYANSHAEFDPHKVAKNINGYFLEDVKVGETVYKKGSLVPSFAFLQADGTTSSGCWIYCGSYTDKGNMAARRSQQDAPNNIGLYPEFAWAWPVNRRIIYNRASVDPAGQPRDAKDWVIKWDGSKWVGDVPDGPWPPLGSIQSPNSAARWPFIMTRHGFAQIFGPGLNDGPFPEHYEPLECPVEKNYMNAQRINPVAPVWGGKADAYATCDPRFPYVGTSYRVSEHWQTGLMTRPQAWLLEMQPQMFVELSEELAALKQIKNGQRVKAVSARGAVECTAIVTKRFKPFKLGDLVVHEVGFPWHYGWRWPESGKEESINLLTPSTGDPNTRIPETKAFMVNIVKI
jgi:formate dehydrogenase major subunit